MRLMIKTRIPQLIPCKEFQEAEVPGQIQTGKMQQRKLQSPIFGSKMPCEQYKMDKSR